MNKYIIIAFLTFFEIVLVAREYSLEELIQISNQKSVSKEIEKTKILEIDAELGKQKADYYPKIKAVVGAEKRESTSEPGINDDHFMAEIRVDYNIFNFGNTGKKINALKSMKAEQVRFANYSNRGNEIDLKKEFYKGLYYKEALETLKKEIEFNQTLKKQVTYKEKQGLVGNADILEIEMREATLKSKVIEYTEHLRQVHDNIKKMTFLSYKEKVLLKGKLQHKPIDVKLQDLLEASRNFNRDLKLSEARMKSLEFELASAKTKGLPKINLRGQYGKLSLDEQNTNDSFEGMFGVYIDIPLFDGGVYRSDLRLQRSRLTRSKLILDKTRLDLEINVTHEYVKMLNIHKQVGLGKINVKNSEVYFKNVLTEYKNGVKNSMDLVSARDRLMNFKNELVKAKMNFLVAQANLERVSGISFD
jgi:outer membrane protein TolC